MANQRIFVQGKESTTSPSLTRSTPVGLPPDLLEAASQRLSLAALLYAIAYSVSFSIGRFTTSPLFEQFEQSSVGDVAALAAVSLSLAVFWLARSGRFDRPNFSLPKHRVGDSFGAGTNYPVLPGEETGEAASNGLGAGGKTGSL